MNQSNTNISSKLSTIEKTQLINSINESNSDFSEHIMTVVEKHQILSDIEIEILTNKTESSTRFHCSFPYFKFIDNNHSVADQIKDNTGINRYYNKTYVLNGKKYVMTSQLYGLGDKKKHSDSRMPFYMWILNKFGISKETLSNRIGTFNSWEVIAENTVIKTCDKSFFQHNDSGVPKEICWFFDAEDILQGKSRQITLTYDGKDYIGKISNDTTDRIRTRISWTAELGNIFKQLQNNTVQRLIFKKENKRYLIFFEDSKQEVSVNKEDNLTKKAWLLTWNPSSWKWDELPTAIQTSKSGKTVHSNWSCISTHVMPGDRVYLIVLGSIYERGIIASGYATSKTYVNDHWDDGKAELGKKSHFIEIDFDCILDPAKNKVLSQLDLKTRFPLQEWSPQGSGISIKAEYIDDLEKMWHSLCLGGEQEVSKKQTIDTIKDYIKDAGFTYPDGMIENFWLSLKSKPFVILAGTSGTGKTRLVRLFANAISAEYKLVAVRPDWSDSSDLFGHVDLNGNFIPGSVLDFINQAKANPKKPYILCLDEMNLARVEYYLSDMLSIMETRELKNGIIESDPIITENYYGRDTHAREIYGIQRIPENFYIIGTVNMDETTFPFSRKVLDRANTIEFSYVDLAVDFDDISEKHQKLNLSNDFLKTDYLFISQCIADKEYIEKVCDALQKINEILQEGNAHVGYRVRDEIVFYMLNNNKSKLIDEKEAFDNEIMQKILPRIQGSSASVKKLLCTLFVELEGSYSDINGSDSENMRNYIKEKADNLRHPKSANKIFFMTRRFEEDGFTSYWL